MPKVKLNHHCRKPGCVGNIGEEIEVSAADAKYLIGRGGATYVKADSRRPRRSKPSIDEEFEEFPEETPEEIEDQGPPADAATGSTGEAPEVEGVPTEGAKPEPAAKKKAAPKKKASKKAPKGTKWVRMSNPSKGTRRVRSHVNNPGK